MKTLDKSRPYATICGHGEKHRFEQDGLKFDANGNEIGTPKKVEPPKAVEPVETETIPTETRLLIVDKNANGYMSIPEIKAALTKAGVEFNQKNNSRKSLLKLLKDYMGVA